MTGHGSKFGHEPLGQWLMGHQPQSRQKNWVPALLVMVVSSNTIAVSDSRRNDGRKDNRAGLFSDTKFEAFRFENQCFTTLH